MKKIKDFMIAMYGYAKYSIAAKELRARALLLDSYKRQLKRADNELSIYRSYVDIWQIPEYEDSWSVYAFNIRFARRAIEEMHPHLINGLITAMVEKNLLSARHLITEKKFRR